MYPAGLGSDNACYSPGSLKIVRGALVYAERQSGGTINPNSAQYTARICDNYCRRMPRVCTFDAIVIFSLTGASLQMLPNAKTQRK